jgi:hypothetical protein
VLRLCQAAWLIDWHVHQDVLTRRTSCPERLHSYGPQASAAATKAGKRWQEAFAVSSGRPLDGVACPVCHEEMVPAPADTLGGADVQHERRSTV